MARYDGATALVVTDVQNDFADPAGNLSVPGGADVVAAVNREIAEAREAGALVVYSQDWHPESTPHFAKDGGVWPVHCVGGTWGAEFHPDLWVMEDAEFVKKGTGGEDGYSVFTVRDPATGQEAGTVLERILRTRSMRRIVVVGLATDYCVKETVLDGRRLGFEAFVPEDAVAAVNLQPEDGERALVAMRAAGAAIV
jgi:nicotinamidase/pyrazinamidase